MTQHRDWSRRLYSEALCEYPTAFWAERSGTESQSGPAGKVPAPAPAPAPDQLIRLSEHTKFISAPCLTDRLVEKMECVNHTNLAEPVAFLGTIHLATKLRQAKADLPVSARRLLETWSASMPPNGAFALLAWAWRNGLFVDASQGDDTARTRSGRQG